jgi:putative FmdB family regulatory protein
MPSYEFKCSDCFRLQDKYFSFSEEHKILCDNCNKPMSKVMQATPAIFTGGGWGGM